VLSNSQGPQTLSDLVDELGPQARAAIPAQAAAAGDWVVVTIPVGAIGTVPWEPLVGKTVIDTGNYYAPRDGSIPELESQELADSELLQRHLAEAHVVKAFNNIHYLHLRALPRPVDAADRTALPIAGNDPGAKEHGAELLSLLGYDSVDIGPLTESWRSQLGTPVFCAPYAVTKDDQYRTQPAAPPLPRSPRGAGVGTALSHERLPASEPGTSWWRTKRPMRIGIVGGTGREAKGSPSAGQRPFHRTMRGGRPAVRRGSRRRHAEKPPSIVRLAPLMYVDSGRAR
jgi:predicted dinucleotide-binding enzyme